MIVADASVVIAALIEPGSLGRAAMRRLETGIVAAPEVVDLEVVSGLRGLVRGGRLDAVNAGRSLAGLQALPLQRFPHEPLLPRIWQLRDNLTAYDASYVALAETLGCSLVTGDAGIAHSPGLRCRVEVLV